MGLKSYTLRAPYEDTLVGATVPTGVDGGMLDIMEALNEGNGEILTDDSMLQSILDNFYGAHGLVFKSKNASASGEPNVETNEPEVGVTGTKPPPSSDAPPLPPSDADSVASVPNAEHGEESMYSQFTTDELKQTLSERGVQFPSRATKADLVQALEQDDQSREGVGSDS